MLPSAKTLAYKGESLVAVNHGIDEVRVLRNLGINAPGPIQFYYDWPGGRVPFAHQPITADFLTLNPRAFCFNDMGTGKTMSVLWAMDFMIQVGTLRKVLVIAPLSTLEEAWADSLFRALPHRSFAVLHGDRARRMKMAKLDVDFFIINHDGVKCAQTMQLLHERGDIDAVVIDEIDAFCNTRTERWKALNTFINGDKKARRAGLVHAYGCTGTPVPESPADAYGIAKLIVPHRVTGFFGAFRDSVMRKVAEHKYEPRADAIEVVMNALQPAIRYERSQCLDLPETTYSSRSAPMTKEQRDVYDSMVKSLKAETEGSVITAINEASKRTKLLQISLGVVYTPMGEVVLDVTPRLELLSELVAASRSKVIVFVPFTAALERVAEFLRNKWSVAVINGETSKNARTDIFRSFQDSTDPHVLVANPGTMAHGLTLTAASTTVWFGPPDSNRVWEQANARTPRPGQKLQTHIVTIESTPVERKTFDRLKKKQALQGTLLEVLAE